ncbi:hypothetical protein OEZ85_008860 [Tetradesmus obliquus]|uniref:Methyltransferase domain-containing protein n=1 Tax=Tetradesmus obliquus TaxID=3088 RepID=A0ABY8TK14_TETOB|nr:hypothetical protein OEZ85_008860 [Tetradesmus obliquus]
MDGSPIVVTENVVEYRKAITELVTAEDVVLEVGCAEGVTTALIADAAKQVVGIDKSPSQAAKAAARHQGIANLSFAQVDGYDLAAVRRLADAAGIRQFSVIFIDVSGSRKVGDVETLLVKYEQVFNPRLFVVKAYQLKRLIMRCQLCTVAGHAVYPGDNLAIQYFVLWNQHTLCPAVNHVGLAQAFSCPATV